MNQRRFVPVVAVMAALLAPEAQAQTAPTPDEKVAEILASARQVLSAVPPRQSCAATSEDEIVVCASGDGERYRVPSSTDLDPGSRAALRTGVPAPPAMDRGSCRGQPGCIVGGWAPPPIHYIDLKAIPEAPEGSDADRIARGEAAER